MRCGIIKGMRIMEEPLKREDLRKAEVVFNDEMVKAVVDVEREVVAIDAEMHADLEQMLLADGSRQDDLWGINLYSDGYDENGIVEFDSMINVRPRQGNRSRDVESLEVRKKIIQVVQKWVN